MAVSDVAVFPLVQALAVNSIKQLELTHKIGNALDQVITDTIPGVGPKAFRVWVEDPIPLTVDIAKVCPIPLGQVQVSAAGSWPIRIAGWPSNTNANPVFVKTSTKKLATRSRRLSI